MSLLLKRFDLSCIMWIHLHVSSKISSVLNAYVDPDSEHILEIAMCSKNKQSLYEFFFHLHKKD